MEQMINDWHAARRALRAAEAAEHPDRTDILGRTWTWISGDLYRHDGMAWPLASVVSERVHWPRPDLIDHPGYSWCGTCRRGMLTAELATQGLRLVRYDNGVLNLTARGREMIPADVETFRLALTRAGYEETGSWVATQGASWLSDGVFAGVSFRVREVQ